MTATDWRTLNKTKLQELARSIINPAAMGQEFESEFLSDLVAERHYYCSAVGLRPLKFRKIADRPPYTFQGFFDGLGWRSVSWRKCVDGFSFRADMKRALRSLVEMDVTSFKSQNQICSKCGAEATEVDHVDPEFDVMAMAALALVTPDDERALLLAHDWLSDEEWHFPVGHEAVAYLLQVHKTAKLMAVCHSCHLANARARRASNP